jgi:hypothetical protein
MKSSGRHAPIRRGTVRILTRKCCYSVTRALLLVPQEMDAGCWMPEVLPVTLPDLAFPRPRWPDLTTGALGVFRVHCLTGHGGP